MSPSGTGETIPKTESLDDLVGYDLKRFTIREMLEVFHVDERGIRSGSDSSVGFFHSRHVGEAFAELHSSKDYYSTRTALVLTDGVVAFVLDSHEPVKMFNDEEETLKLREEALKKLTPSERAILGL